MVLMHLHLERVTFSPKSNLFIKYDMFIILQTKKTSMHIKTFKKYFMRLYIIIKVGSMEKEYN